ncbi:PP2C family protein-serine/threonine phosphatase [Actinomadura sp. 21ATH]|uniref:PP2C family protein-serine/threonine phosphatase n=1 Tax=Actinomadura sp. 21ATH TaxID=1735444 RepID=UPI0035C009EE
MRLRTGGLDGRLLLRLPYGVMGVIAAADFLGGPGAGYLPLLSLGPAFASLAGGVRRTASIGLLSVTLCVALAAYNNSLGGRGAYLALLSIIGVTAAAMLASELRERKERELSDIRTVAEVAQRVLLRPVPRRVGPIHAAVSYTSASARARIGGDLYEVVTTPDGVRVLVGDVQGKGLDAVETAAVVLGAFREAAYDEPDLPGVAVRLERALSRHLTGEQFVTAVLAEIGPGDKAGLLNCGHPPPLMIRSDGRTEPADPPDVAPPLGLMDMATAKAPPFEVDFGPGDQMLLYTDGVIEARDAAGRFYPLAERSHLLSTGVEPQEALDRLQNDLVEHVGGPIKDDAAMLLLRHRSR